MRIQIANQIARLMNVTGFRFSKSYRNGATLWHRAVYRFVDTVSANFYADCWPNRRG